MTSTARLTARLAFVVAAAILIAIPDTASAATVRYAFAYAYQPTPTAPWQIHSGHSFNSTGGAIAVTQVATGEFVFSFGGISALGTAQARAHGSNNRCKVVDWTASGADTLVRVRCVTPAGAPVDDLVVVQYYHATGTDPLQTAYLRAEQPVAASYAPSAAYSYNSTGAINTVSRGSELGEYLALLPGLTTRGGDPHVTAYGTTNDYCKVATWYQSSAGTSVAVRCFDGNGDPVNARWTLRYTHGHLADDNTTFGGYVLGNDDWGPGTASFSYTPNPQYQLHTGGTVMIVDNGGRSQAHMPGARAISSVLVTAVGHDNSYCSTFGWWHSGFEFIPVASCYDPAGNLVGSGYTMTLLTRAPR